MYNTLQCTFSIIASAPPWEISCKFYSCHWQLVPLKPNHAGPVILKISYLQTARETLILHCMVMIGQDDWQSWGKKSTSWWLHPLGGLKGVVTRCFSSRALGILFVGKCSPRHCRLHAFLVDCIRRVQCFELIQYGRVLSPLLPKHRLEGTIEALSSKWLSYFVMGVMIIV